MDASLAGVWWQNVIAVGALIISTLLSILAIWVARKSNKISRDTANRDLVKDLEPHIAKLLSSPSISQLIHTGGGPAPAAKMLASIAAQSVRPATPNAIQHDLDEFNRSVGPLLGIDSEARKFVTHSNKAWSTYFSICSMMNLASVRTWDKLPEPHGAIMEDFGMFIYRYLYGLDSLTLSLSSDKAVKDATKAMKQEARRARETYDSEPWSK